MSDRPTATDLELYAPDEAAGVLKTNPRTMERWRASGDGPAFVKIGRRVAYTRSSLADFVQRRTYRFTTETRKVG